MFSTVSGFKFHVVLVMRLSKFSLLYALLMMILRWGRHIRCWSRASPRYVTCFKCWIWFWCTDKVRRDGFSWTRDRCLGGRETMTWVLSELMESPHLLHQKVKELIASVMVLFIFWMVLLQARNAVSSAYWNSWMLGGRGGMSATKRM